MMKTRVQSVWIRDERSVALILINALLIALAQDAHIFITVLIAEREQWDEVTHRNLPNMQVLLVLAYFRYSQELKVESTAFHFGIVSEEKLWS